MELNQVVLREDIDAMNHKVGQMLEAQLALLKNNFQHVVTENVDRTSRFTMVNNPLYNSPPQMDDSIQPQSAHNTISNKIHMVQGHSTIQVGHIPPPHTTENPQEVDPVINVTTHLDTKVIQLCRVMGEQIRALEGKCAYGMDVVDMFLVSYIIIPSKFKILDFEKYIGVRFPKTHLTMFIRKMATYAHDDKFLIHCFQDSLNGESLEWYTQLKETISIHGNTWIWSS